MPSLRDRETLKAPQRFKIWEEGDPHAPMFVRKNKSETKAKRKSLNKKYGEVRKAKLELGADQSSGKSQSGSLKVNQKLKKEGSLKRKNILKEKGNKVVLDLSLNQTENQAKAAGKLVVKFNFKKT